MPTIAASHARSASLSGFASSLSGRTIVGLAATAAVAAAAHIAIPLPFTPVPLTLQPLAVLGVGLALGPAAGFLAMLAYLVEGLCGLPVFSPTGPGGLAQLLGPTGGFLMAYPLVAALAGGVPRVLPKRLPRFAAASLGGFAAILVLFILGAGWFMHYTHLSVEAAWIGAVAPFLPGEIIKVFVAAGVYSTLMRHQRN